MESFPRSATQRRTATARSASQNLRPLVSVRPSSSFRFTVDPEALERGGASLVVRPTRYPPLDEMTLPEGMISMPATRSLDLRRVDPLRKTTVVVAAAASFGASL